MYDAVVTLTASPVLKSVFGNGSRNSDIINFSQKCLFSDFRGGPADSTEELPVKIQVLCLSYDGLFSR